MGAFHTWCIDTITNLGASPKGYTHLVVCVDAFTKWVEAWPAEGLTARERVELFHLNITCRYGTPAVVRSDRGTEFQGVFL